MAEKENAPERVMKTLALRTAALVLALAVFCVAFRLLTGSAYYLPVPESYGRRPEAAGLRLSVEEPDRVGASFHRRGSAVWIRIDPREPGFSNVSLVDPDGHTVLRQMPVNVDRLGTVYDYTTGGFTGDTALILALTAFFLTESILVFLAFRQARGPAFYAYSTIFSAGFSVFSLLTGVLMLIVTVRHLTAPLLYPMYSVYSALSSAPLNYMLITSPFVLLFAGAMTVSNIALLRHERRRIQNFLGIAVSLLMLLGEIPGFFLFFSDVSGSESFVRTFVTVRNVYAAFYVYFECMLIGSIICGLKAARHVPAPDRDVIIILGCRFRPDGTLTPLLRGRVDRALDFRRARLEATGREVLLIPSGGRGSDEPMPEAEAMRRYLLSRGVPDACIIPESRSVSTTENMRFSREIIDREAPGASVAFATTSYHVFRSGVCAAEAGMRAEGMGSRTRWWFWPNAFMRECAGLFVRRWKQELLLLLVLLAFFGTLSLVL